MQPRLRATAVFSAAMFVFSMLATAPVAVASNGINEDDPDKPPIGHEISDRKYLNLREKQIALYRGFPFRLPYNGRKVAINQMVHQRQQQAQHGLSGPDSVAVWAPIGPDPIPNGQVAGGATNVAVSGRVTAIVVDPGNANVVYVGTAQGGVYRSSNANAATPTWTPLMDNADSLAVGALALDPTDSTTLYVGTGEGNFSLDSFAGVGIYKITGANSGSGTLHGPFDTKVAGTGTTAGGGSAFNGESITSIAIDPNDHAKMFVGTSLGFSGASGDVHFTRAPIGLYWSGNADTATPTFSRVSGIPGDPNSTVSDVMFAPTSSSVLYVGVGDLATTNSGLYKSTNAQTATTGTSGVSPIFTRVVNTSGNIFNIKLGANKVLTTTTVLAAIENTSGGRLIESTDAFASAPTTLTDAAGYCGGQCYYDIAIAIDPSTAQNIYLGGSADGGAATQFERSTDGGTTFNVSDTNLHADTHAIAIAPSNHTVLYHGNDGGIFRSADSGATWTSINTPGFLATQFESIAVHPTNANFTIGGSQDNGSEMRNGAGNWTRADFGDGGFSAIDQNATNTTTVTMYHTYFNQTNNVLGFARVTQTSDAHDGGWDFFGCGGTPNGINCTDATLFYAPVALGPGSPNTVYFGSDRLYRSANSGVTATTVGGNTAIEAGIPISAIGIAPLDDKVRIVGLTNGHVYRTTSAAPTSLVAVTGGWPAGKYVARAVIDPTASGTAYVTLDGYAGGTTSALSHVWKTTNLGAATPTWVSKGAGIPDVPVNAFVIDPNDHLHLFAGTDIGVYESVDGGTNWTPFGTGLPIVAIFDMAIAQPGTASEVLRVATHGKGMWETAIVSGSSFTLTAHLAGSGSGTVTSTDANINCPGTCFHDYGVLTNGIVIQQTPGGSSTFGGWSGCDSVVGTDCHINVNGAENVTATFDSADSTPPTASMTLPVAPVNGSKAISLAWSGDDGGGTGVKNFDVRVHKAKYTTSTFGSFTNPSALQATTSTSATFTGAPGFTYCFSVRATDNASNVGAYSGDSCIEVPVDDRGLTHSTGWTLATDNAAYLKTISTSSTHNKTLTLANVHAKQIGIIVTQCPTCGTITFTFGGKTFGIDLHAATIKHLQLFTTTPYATIKTGTLTIKITSATGKKVPIDGVAAIIRNLFTSTSGSHRAIRLE